MSYDFTPSPTSSGSTPTIRRPGCVTVYAILLWLGGALILLSVLCSGVGSLPGYPSEFALGTPLMMTVLGFAAIASIITGVGLWGMKTWGWWLVVILQSSGLAISAIRFFVFALAGGMAKIVVSLTSTCISSLVSAVILYWFVTNRGLFGVGTPEYQTVTRDSGEVIQQPVVKGEGIATALAIIAGVAVVLVLVAVCAIVTLALMGPSVGNVFSNIILDI